MTARRAEGGARGAATARSTTTRSSSTGGAPARTRHAERPEGATYRMKDLCALTGLERQTVHFYIQEGLVPEGHKVGRNMAFYGPEHLERLRLVKKLQQERFLPLRAIRAVVSGKVGGFTAEQRVLLADVKERLADAPDGQALVRSGGEHDVEVRELVALLGIPASDVEEMIDLGLLSGEGGPRSRRIRGEDVWLVEAWAELVRAGLSRARGFSPRDIALIDEAVAELFARERELFVERFEHRPADEIARTLAGAIPVLSRVLARLHEQKARDTFELVGERPAAPASSVSNPTTKERSRS